MDRLQGTRGLVIASLTLVAVGGCSHAHTKPAAGVVDPGVAEGPTRAGGPLPGLSDDEQASFDDGRTRFMEVEAVTGGANNGLGPRFNSNQCASCHSQPSVGGTSPARNPLIQVATLSGARNELPWFIVPNGPIREARLKLNADGTPDGGVRDLFVVTGRSDAVGCTIAQPSFLPAGQPLTGRGGNPNLALRIPTPLFGAGLIEAIPDSVILANMKTSAAAKAQLGIRGHPNAHISGTANTSANDGTITRFGWKAQNKSLLVFAAEAYNVEMGVTNQLFPQERDETPGCLFNATPEDVTRLSATSSSGAASDIEAFASFMRLLAPPAPAVETPAIANGRAAFEAVGCAACHTPTLRTGRLISSGSSKGSSDALSDQPVHLYSDLLLHHMGHRLADGIQQGQAGPDEFRTAPLWGLGQRVFFLHDGRTTSLLDAIEAHRSRESEASLVVEAFHKLSAADQQDLLTFLRSL
jgi:CxxC motif-containing protein (DUF1111 family)